MLFYFLSLFFTIVALATPESYLEQKLANNEFSLSNLNQTFVYQNRRFKISDFDTVISRQIRPFFRSVSLDQARQFTQNYAAAKLNIIQGGDSAKKTEVLDNLDVMLGFTYGSRKNLELTKILECRDNSSLNPVTDLLERLERTTEVANCAPLNPGEHKVFEKKNDYLSGDYLLKRNANGVYQVVLNVDFRSGAGSISPAAMLERAKECVKNASLALKGPNGERMEIGVMSPAEIESLPSNERPKSNVVKIEDSQYQTTAAAYSENVKCDTITHELFHLLGLCDEYPEDRPEFMRFNWTCRVVTSAPSIMRDLSTFEKALPKVTSCNCSSAGCRGVMTGNREDVKRLYTSRTAYDYLPSAYRTKYCSETSFTRVNPSTLKNVTVSNVSNYAFSAQTMFVGDFDRAPFYQILSNTISCSCPPSDAECLATKNIILTEMVKPVTYSQSCPQGASKISDRIEGGTPGAQFSNNVLTITAQASVPSLLQPSHFYKILEGSCGGQSNNYNTCAQHAYKGDPCNVPPQCRLDSFYLRSSIQ